MKLVTVNLAVEDTLCEVLLREIIRYSGRPFAVGHCYGKIGYTYVKQKVSAFNNAAKVTPFFVLADLVTECAPNQVREWLPENRHPNLLFRIAVKEIESWLLADRIGFASFLGVSPNLIPNNAEEIPHPKRFLLNLARRVRRRALREALLPLPNTTAAVGPDYNGQLASFARDRWNIEAAMPHSDSLHRTVVAIKQFRPI